MGAVQSSRRETQTDRCRDKDRNKDREARRGAITVPNKKGGGCKMERR